MVAAQDADVRRYCRSIKGVPLIFVRRSVMVMEPMVGDSILQRDDMERSKLRSGLKKKGSCLLGKRKSASMEMDGMQGSSKENIDNDQGDEQVRKKIKVKGPKGPNPLAVKKPKRIRSDAQWRNDEDSLRSSRETAPIEDNGEYASIPKTTPEIPSGEQQEQPNKRKRRRKHKAKESGGVVDGVHGENENL